MKVTPKVNIMDMFGAISRYSWALAFKKYEYVSGIEQSNMGL
jgi:hypothetical protein